VGVEQRGCELAHLGLERADRLGCEAAVDQLAVGRVLGRIEREELLGVVVPRFEAQRGKRLVERGLHLVARTESVDAAGVHVRGHRVGTTPECNHVLVTGHDPEPRAAVGSGRRVAPHRCFLPEPSEVVVGCAVACPPVEIEEIDAFARHGEDR
jgi:hypothetical protein